MMITTPPLSTILWCTDRAVCHTEAIWKYKIMNWLQKGKQFEIWSNYRQNFWQRKRSLSTTTWGLTLPAGVSLENVWSCWTKVQVAATSCTLVPSRSSSWAAVTEHKLKAIKQNKDREKKQTQCEVFFHPNASVPQSMVCTVCVTKEKNRKIWATSCCFFALWEWALWKALALCPTLWRREEAEGGSWRTELPLLLEWIWPSVSLTLAPVASDSALQNIMIRAHFLGFPDKLATGPDVNRTGHSCLSRMY